MACQRLSPKGRKLGLGNVRKITKTSGKLKLIDSLRKCDLIKEISTLSRKDVELVTEPSKVRKRRIYTEAEYDLKCGVVPKATKSAKIMDDIEAQLAQLEHQDEAVEKQDSMETKEAFEDESSDEEFYGFPDVTQDSIKKLVKPQQGYYFDFGVEVLEKVDLKNETEPGKGLYCEVGLSPALVKHMKDVLVEDDKAMNVLKSLPASAEQSAEDSRVAKDPSDYPMPPSPESNSPSDGSVEGELF